jgi:hypothetical protein
MDKETFSAINGQESVNLKVLRGLREIATPDQVDELIDLVDAVWRTPVD